MQPIADAKQRAERRREFAKELGQQATKPVYEMNGISEILEVFPDKVEITPFGVGGFFRKGLKGTKTIPFHSITAIQFKEAGVFSGYLQFTIPGGRESHGGLWAAATDENTFVFASRRGNNELALEIKGFVEARVHEARPSRPETSIADEIQKLADLRTKGLLSEEEFQSAKKRLLN